MEIVEALVGIGVIGIFFFIIGSRVYKHEKEQIDPLIEKIKGWFNKEKDSSVDEESDNPWDHNIDFRGQTT